MGRRVVIVGGGLAGLAAAAALTQSDCDITLLESRPRLGGRAGSFFDKDSGEWIDTCQHVAMGCCTNLQYFAHLVGIDELFQTQAELLFIGPSGQWCHFRATRLPAPLHLLGAFFGLVYLSLRERIRLGRDVAKLAQPRWAACDAMPFEQWLGRHSSTADLRERFWDVILISALSETADRISVPHARKVFVDGFLAHRDGWRVQIPTVSLNELYGQRVSDWLRERGVTVATSAGVARIEQRDGRMATAHLRSGDVIEADEFLLAVPWHRVGDLLPGPLLEQPALSGLRELESAPITSVHLWFDRPVLDIPHAVLIGRLSQWVFRRTAPANSPPIPRNSHPECLQVVISASRNVAGRSQVSLIEEVVEELASVWPAVRDVELTSARVITEHRAVFSPQPSVEALRPRQQSPVENLQLAGDWTNTGWPATMEGAVKSGFLAAENILRRLGTPARLVQPGLTPSWLSRWLLGIEKQTT